MLLSGNVSVFGHLNAFKFSREEIEFLTHISVSLETCDQFEKQKFVGAGASSHVNASERN